MNFVSLAVNGGYGQWTSYDTCSATCGLDAYQTSTRDCDSPCAKNGGQDCVGPNIRVRQCPTNVECGGWCYRSSRFD